MSKICAAMAWPMLDVLPPRNQSFHAPTPVAFCWIWVNRRRHCRMRRFGSVSVRNPQARLRCFRRGFRSDVCDENVVLRREAAPRTRYGPLQNVPRGVDVAVNLHLTMRASVDAMPTRSPASRRMVCTSATSICRLTDQLRPALVNTQQRIEAPAGSGPGACAASSDRLASGCFDCWTGPERQSFVN